MTADEAVKRLLLRGSIDLREAVGALCAARGLFMYTFYRPSRDVVEIAVSKVDVMHVVSTVHVETPASFEGHKEQLYDAAAAALDAQISSPPAPEEQRDEPVTPATAFVTCARCGLETGVPERHEIYCSLSEGHDS